MTLSGHCSKTTGPIKLKLVSFESMNQVLSNNTNFIQIDAVVFLLHSLQKMLPAIENPRKKMINFFKSRFSGIFFFSNFQENVLNSIFSRF